MKLETYEKIWKRVINKSITNIKEKYIEECKKKISDEKICEEICNSLKVKDDLENLIYEAYKDCRDSTKERYYPAAEEEIKIDNHKIAACFTEALLRVKAFTYPLNSKESVTNFGLINYEVAFNVGIGVLYETLISYYKKIGMNSYEIKLKEMKNFIFPYTTPGHDSYKIGRIKTLALNDLYGNDFDILTYADMLFWIEHYNRQVIESKIAIKCKDIRDDLND